MLRNLKFSLIALFVVGGVVLLTSSRAHAVAYSLSSDNPASGRALYNQNCARCHGANGRSQTALGRKLEAADLTDDEVQYMDDAKMTRVIKNGRTGMPGFGKKLNADQISAIVKYVRGL